MPKKVPACLFAALLLMTAVAAEARDTRHILAIEQAMATADARAKLDGDIQFLFGKSASADIAQSHGEFTANRKTNAFNKSDTEACNWVFLSAMLALQERARKEGGNAVINIRSFYKKHEIDSSNEFECGAGALIAGVALKGEVVTLK
ncbi:excinuclease ATPase subunit [Microbulbifer litoralis]|uniref:excinuclease ATPase subunit n=1 Tax=Microbulbifer litoralis TaxID=2933965 RepID=UPI0020276E4B|nr:excinuclease ATPase subunit [Microbulbifer sp. GX H0434]